MMGSEIRPTEITEAATTPVVAASRAPTRITAMARPPRSGPKSWPMVSSKSSAMPLRSSTRPISVKNGMASKVSFCMMPNSRSGKACIRASGKTPSSTPTNPKNSPQAPRLKATGKPISRKMISPMNMMGAIFCVINSMNASRSGGFVFGFGEAYQVFRQLFFGSFFSLLERRVLNQALQEGDALDQLGPALQQQQEKAQRNHGVHRPADQAARAA